MRNLIQKTERASVRTQSCLIYKSHQTHCKRIEVLTGEREAVRRVARWKRNSHLRHAVSECRSSSPSLLARSVAVTCILHLGEEEREDEQWEGGALRCYDTTRCASIFCFRRPPPPPRLGQTNTIVKLKSSFIVCPSVIGCRAIELAVA